jgi:hypothetical protein
MEYVSAGCHNLEVLDVSECHQKTDLVIKHVVKCTDLKVLKINFSTHITGSKLYLISLYLPHFAELQLKNCRDFGSCVHKWTSQLHATLEDNRAYEYAIWIIQGNQKGLELTGIHQHLVYSDDVNFFSKGVNAMKNTEALIDTSVKILK